MKTSKASRINLVLLQFALVIVSSIGGATATAAQFVTHFQSYTELESPQSGFPNGRTIFAHIVIPEFPHANMPLVVMNHGSGGVYGGVSDLVQGELSEIALNWSALLTRMGYVTVILDSYTSRGFIGENKLIPCHNAMGNTIHSGSCSPAELTSGLLDGSSYRIPGEPLITATDCGNTCVSPGQQRAYDTNYAADHFASAAFQAELQQQTGAGAVLASVDTNRFYLFGHSAGSVATLAAMFRGHADGEHLPSRGIAVDLAYPRAGRYAAAVAFYPGCYMYGAYRDPNGDSLYYPYAPLLILHGNADDLYRPDDGLDPYHCEQLLIDSRALMQEARINIPFEMVVYTAKGQVDDGDRPGIRHSFDRAYWNDLQDLDWLIPEHMSKIHADATMLKFFSLQPDPGGISLSTSSLRIGAIPYQAYYFPSLPPTWMKNPADNIAVNPNNVVIALPNLVQNPYFYNVPVNPDVSRETEPGDFAIAYNVVGLPAGLSFNASTHSITGTISPMANSPSVFWVVAENNTGRYRQQFLIQPDGQLQLGPGYRVDTVNGVMRSSGAIDVDLDLYLSDVPSTSNVHWADVFGPLPSGAVDVVDDNTLRIEPDRLTLPVTINVELEVGGLLVNETLIVERSNRIGYPAFNRVRFKSNYTALQLPNYPLQDYGNDSPTSGDGYGYDPNDGGVPLPNGSATGLPPGEGVFIDGFEAP